MTYFFPIINGTNDDLPTYDITYKYFNIFRKIENSGLSHVTKNSHELFQYDDSPISSHLFFLVECHFCDLFHCVTSNGSRISEYGM